MQKFDTYCDNPSMFPCARIIYEGHCSLRRLSMKKRNFPFQIIFHAILLLLLVGSFTYILYYNLFLEEYIAKYYIGTYFFLYRLFALPLFVLLLGMLATSILSHRLLKKVTLKNRLLLSFLCIFLLLCYFFAVLLMINEVNIGYFSNIIQFLSKHYLLFLFPGILLGFSNRQTAEKVHPYR